ncbi:MAG: Ni/Fe hydrogenase subunit alpha [Candidatus Thermoplasmatota archaeon]
MRTITIDPITRLEGHGKISIFLNAQGDVENAYLQIPELRGFEQFVRGRRAEDMPQITSRICGVCPVAHHFAATKALDAAYHVEPPSTAKKLRELMHCGYFIYDHILHFYYLGGPDFIVGPDAPKAQRNILGVIEKAGLDIGKQVIQHRAYGQQITGILGGKATHPVCGLPGGVSKALTRDEVTEIKSKAKSCVRFAEYSLTLFHDIVLKNKDYVNLIRSDPYQLPTYNMGLVDQKNKVNFYDGMIRVTDQQGKEFLKFNAHEYTNHIDEQVVDWTYMKYPYLKKVGWKGLTAGKDSGIYRVGPLGRLNVADGMATPRAQKEYQKMYETLGSKPVNSTLAYHWARLIELLYASERAEELINDLDIASTRVRNPIGEPGEGIGVVEAARGTLIHHYKLTKQGLIDSANMIVATTNNAGAITMSIRDAARSVIKKGVINDGILNKIEMAFRAYDPCFGCATHTLPGNMPLHITIYTYENKICTTIIRN